MSKGERILKTTLWLVVPATLLGVVVAKYIVPAFHRHDPPAVMFPGAKFTLTDQNNARFDSEQLRGKPYIASFMFTKCAGICPRMNSVVRDLQKDLPAEFHFVSITVDPANDTPEALKAYAGQYATDPARWHFLTGEMDALKKAALDMKLPDRDWPAAHSDRLVLVDADGNVRGTYHSREEADVKKLIDDAKAVAKLPAGAKPQAHAADPSAGGRL